MSEKIFHDIISLDDTEKGNLLKLLKANPNTMDPLKKDDAQDIETKDSDQTQDDQSSQDDESSDEKVSESEESTDKEETKEEDTSSQESEDSEESEDESTEEETKEEDAETTEEETKEEETEEETKEETEEEETETKEEDSEESEESDESSDEPITKKSLESTLKKTIKSLIDPIKKEIAGLKKNLPKYKLAETMVIDKGANANSDTDSDVAKTISGKVLNGLIKTGARWFQNEKEYTATEAKKTIEEFDAWRGNVQARKSVYSAFAEL